MASELSTEQRTRLIELVREHPALYDMKHAEYSNRDVKRQLWEQVAEQLEIPGEYGMEQVATLCCSGPLVRTIELAGTPPYRGPFRPPPPRAVLRSVPYAPCRVITERRAEWPFRSPSPLKRYGTSSAFEPFRDVPC